MLILSTVMLKIIWYLVRNLTWKPTTSYPDVRPDVQMLTLVLRGIVWLLTSKLKKLSVHLSVSRYLWIIHIYYFTLLWFWILIKNHKKIKNKKATDKPNKQTKSNCVAHTVYQSRVLRKLWNQFPSLGEKRRFSIFAHHDVYFHPFLDVSAGGISRTTAFRDAGTGPYCFATLYPTATKLQRNNFSVRYILEDAYQQL